MNEGQRVLHDIETMFRKYTIQRGDDEYTALALYAAFTHGSKFLEFAPRLSLTSPTKQCGKTRTLEVLAALSYNPLMTSNISGPALYRSIPADGDTKTIFIDEADTLFKLGPQSKQAEALRGVLNTGFRRGQSATRCEGPLLTPTEYSTFSPVVLAAIHGIPSTVADRAVNIRLHRRAANEVVSDYRVRRDEPALHELRDRIASWVTSNEDSIIAAQPQGIPLRDREADTWEPLIVISDLAGGRWPQASRQAAERLTAAYKTQDARTPEMELLDDIRTALKGWGSDQIPSTVLIDELEGLEESRWAEYGMTPRRLANALGEFDISPRHLKDGKRRGYDARELTKAIERYLPAPPGEQGDEPSVKMREWKPNQSS
ncbi:DUF3631 domain-containing protein [Brachybacterium tyrofermentans]|uniref:DUF3631 domain-containing protein n=1 Tax=Brachybacterium tyrofermentans TaxID=47848 RepID=UPI003F90E1BE